MPAHPTPARREGATDARVRRPHPGRALHSKPGALGRHLNSPLPAPGPRPAPLRQRDMRQESPGRAYRQVLAGSSRGTADRSPRQDGVGGVGHRRSPGVSAARPDFCLPAPNDDNPGSPSCLLYADPAMWATTCVPCRPVRPPRPGAGCPASDSTDLPHEAERLGVRPAYLAVQRHLRAVQRQAGRVRGQQRPNLHDYRPAAGLRVGGAGLPGRLDPGSVLIGGDLSVRGRRGSVLWRCR